jgi:ribosomal protein S18 acetylase RimI-like enzyme
MFSNVYSFGKPDKNELPDLFLISKDIISGYYATFLGADIATNYINSKQHEKEIIDNMENCIIMKLEKAIIGFSITLKNKIHLIMIDRKHQNKNHGTYLLKHIENLLFQKYDTIELQSFAHNTIANNFYKKNGWKKIEEINADGFLLHRYSKTITK